MLIPQVLMPEPDDDTARSSQSAVKDRYDDERKCRAAYSDEEIFSGRGFRLARKRFRNTGSPAWAMTMAGEARPYSQTHFRDATRCGRNVGK
jgi:hypothetical protein